MTSDVTHGDSLPFLAKANSGVGRASLLLDMTPASMLDVAPRRRCPSSSVTAGPVLLARDGAPLLSVSDTLALQLTQCTVPPRKPLKRTRSRTLSPLGAEGDHGEGECGARAPGDFSELPSEVRGLAT